MAVTSTALSSLAQYPWTDNPSFLPYNVLNGSTDGKWSDDGDHDSPATDKTDSEFPVEFTCDHKAHFTSKPIDNTLSTWYITFAVPTANQARQVTHIVIINHNLDDATNIYTDFSNNAAFSSGIIGTVDIAGSIPGNGQRIAHAFSAAYSGFTHFRLEIIAPATFQPYIGEIYLGGDLQNLPYGPIQPYDEKMRESSFASFESQGGVISNYPLHTRRAVFNLELIFGTDDETNRLREVWEGSDGGRKAVIYTPNINAATLETYLVNMPKMMEFPNIEGLATRRFSFPLRENAPFYDKE